MRTIALATLAALATIGMARAATLDFPSMICGAGAMSCGNGSDISDTYGDIPGQLNVSYDDGAGSMALNYWSTSYSELVGVAYGGAGDSNGRSEIFFEPASGFEVTVSSFRLGAWPNSDRTTQVSVLTGAGTPLFESAQGITILGAQSSLFSGPWTSTEGIRIQWGPSSFSVGIDDIEFSVQRIGAQIPLPAAGWLLVSGVASLAVMRRRTR